MSVAVEVSYNESITLSSYWKWCNEKVEEHEFAKFVVVEQNRQMSYHRIGQLQRQKVLPKAWLQKIYKDAKVLYHLGKKKYTQYTGKKNMLWSQNGMHVTSKVENNWHFIKINNTKHNWNKCEKWEQSCKYIEELENFLLS